MPHLRRWNGIGGTTGIVVVFIVGVIFMASIYRLSRNEPVDQHNVNAEWTGSVVPDRKTVPA